MLDSDEDTALHSESTGRHAIALRHSPTLAHGKEVDSVDGVVSLEHSVST